jgi:hypothetical protein
MRDELTRLEPGKDQEFPSPAACVQQLRNWDSPGISSNVKRRFLPRDQGSWREQLTTDLEPESRLKPAKIFHYPHTFKQPVWIRGRGKSGPEDIQTPVQKKEGVLSTKEKRQERAADHSTPSGAEVMNEWRYAFPLSPPL